MDRDSRLADAVDELTLPRTLTTWLYDDNELPTTIHSELHPPLLTLLVQGTGITRKESGSAEVALPIDADAVELWSRIVAAVRGWNQSLGIAFERDALAASLRAWHTRHDALVRTNVVSMEADNYALATVEAWVRQITKKFDPDKIIEFTDPCPAILSSTIPVVTEWTDYTENDPPPTITVTKPCGARRIERDGVFRYAVSVNLTQQTAECVVCGTRWEGKAKLMELRYLANMIAAAKPDTPFSAELAFGGSMPDH